MGQFGDWEILEKPKQEEEQIQQQQQMNAQRTESMFSTLSMNTMEQINMNQSMDVGNMIDYAPNQTKQLMDIASEQMNPVNATMVADGESLVAHKPITQKKKGFFSRIRDWWRNSRRLSRMKKEAKAAKKREQKRYREEEIARADEINRERENNFNPNINLTSLRIHDVVQSEMKKEDVAAKDFNKYFNKDTDIDGRTMRAFAKIYEVKTDGTPATEEDEKKRQYNEDMVKAFSTKDLEKRRPFLDDIVKELTEAPISDKMLNPEWLKNNIAYFRKITTKFTYYENTVKNKVNKPYFEEIRKTNPDLYGLIDSKYTAFSELSRIVMNYGTNVWFVAITARGNFVPENPSYDPEMFKQENALAKKGFTDAKKAIDTFTANIEKAKQKA